MKSKFLLISAALTLFFVSGCAHSSINQPNVKDSNDSAQVSSPSWSSDKIIVFNKIVYMGSDEKVANTDIQSQLGQIEQYSDDEKVSGNKENFSNFYPVGTKLYTVKNYSSQKAIAVEVGKDTFVLAKVRIN